MAFRRSKALVPTLNTEIQIRIGTSGWHYDHWVGSFYPEASPSDKMLGFYSKRFDTVEINNSFYQIPDEKTMRTWLETVGDDFDWIKISKKLEKEFGDLRNTLTT